MMQRRKEMASNLWCTGGAQIFIETEVDGIGNRTEADIRSRNWSSFSEEGQFKRRVAAK